MAHSVGTVLLCLSVCGIGVISKHLDYNENDVCKQQEGTSWTCQKLSNCPSAQAEVMRGAEPEKCSFLGEEPLVCCKPESPGREKRQTRAQRQRSQRISWQKCQEYAKSVFKKEKDPTTGEEYDRDLCADVEPLITNGTKASPKEFPHMALIGYGNRNNIQWRCGGSLISERFVLSAAHCTDAGGKLKEAKWVRLGEYNMLSTEDDEGKQAEPRDYRIIERINHPDYQKGKSYNDIALYKLETTVQFTEFVRPVCLQINHRFTKSPIATGWGRVEAGGALSRVLMKVKLNLIERNACTNEFKGITDPRLSNGIQERLQLCAGDLENGKDTCQGDSGGPLQIRLREPYCMYSQVAVTSVGIRCAVFPGIYTRVSNYVPWIERNVWPQ